MIAEIEPAAAPRAGRGPDQRPFHRLRSGVAAANFGAIDGSSLAPLGEIW
jgi:hypothetical protein